MTISMNRLVAVALALLPCLAARASQPGSQPATTQPATTLPAGVKIHQQPVRQSPNSYTVHMGGTMDGLNTRGPIGYRVFDQAFEPNVEVSIANVGQEVVHNPRLRIDGRGGWRNIQEMVATFTAGLKSDAEKARAAFEFQRKHRHHCSSYDAEVRDVVKALNCYGYTLCFDDSKCLGQLWQGAGLQTRRGWPYGHSVTEVFYDDAWHMMDGDEHCIFLLRDNKTIASEEQFVRDSDLVKRTHSYGPLERDNPLGDQGGAGLFYYEGPRGGGWREKSSHTMDFDLRPGEKIAWRWDYAGRYHGFEDLAKWNRATTRVCNGYLEYSPDLNELAQKKGVLFADLPMEEGIRQVVAIPVKSAWPIVGGWIEITCEAPAQLQEVLLVKSGQQEPVSVWQTDRQIGDGKTVRIDLDEQFPAASPACYDFRLQFIVQRLNSACNCPTQPDPVKSFTLHSTLQMAWLAMPSLACGDNQVAYTDDNSSRQVRIEHQWTEHSDGTPPAAPPAPKFPQDGATVTGTKFTFEWVSPKAGEPIRDYWFELSDRPDMRWVLSPNFEKRISYTKQAGTASYEVPSEGLLSPGQKYYWRVRAKTEKGVWGPWSATWSFTVKAPAPPVGVQLDWDKDKRVLTLSWQPNPEGDRPAKYTIYASNEQGFAARDEPYEANGGQAGTLRLAGNRVAQTTETSLAIQPSDEARMFYRVVALAADGTPSGPSDYAQAPGPIICTTAPSKIPYGQATTFPMKALASVGNLQSRAVGEKSYQGIFGLNADELRWSIHSDTHASIDPKTGTVHIQPAIWDLGSAEFVVICRNQRGQSDAYRFTLEVGAPGEAQP